MLGYKRTNHSNSPLERPTKSPSFHSLPPEILIHIFTYIPQKQLVRLGHASLDFARALKCIPYFSATDIIDLLYQGNYQPLLQFYLTNDLSFSKCISWSLREKYFKKHLAKHRDPVVTCRQFLLVYAEHGIVEELPDPPLEDHAPSNDWQFFTSYMSHSPKKKVVWKSIDNNVVVHSASVEVFDFLTSEYNTAEKIRLAMQGNNTATALAILERLDETDSNNKTRLNMSHASDPRMDYDMNLFMMVRGSLLQQSVKAMHLICILSKIDPNSTEGKKILYGARKADNLSLVLMDALLSGHLRLENPIIQLICWMFLSGSSIAMNKMLTYPELDPSRWDSLALHFALRYGDKDTILAVLQDSRVNPGARADEALIYAVKNGHDDLVQQLLQHPRVSPASQKHETIRLAMNLRYFSIFQMLITHPKVGIRFLTDHVLVAAIKSKYREAVRFLLNHPKVNPAATKNRALKEALNYTCPDIALWLLNNDRVHPSVEDLQHLKAFLVGWESDYSDELWSSLAVHLPMTVDHADLMTAIQTSNTRAVRYLLRHPSIDPGQERNAALVQCVSDKSLTMFKLLLNDPRVDPSDQGNIALQIVFRHVYERGALWKLADPQFIDKRPIDYVTPRTYEWAQMGRLLLQNPQVQTALAQEYPELDDPSVYQHFFLKRK